MKKSKKVLLTMLSAAALMVTTVFGTVAYFQDKDADVNTFTVGRVHIELDESDVKADGTYERNDDGSLKARVKKNEYHLIPGQTYIKDPTVTVQANSANAYVFVTVKNQIADIEWNDDNSYSSIVTQMTRNGWKLLTEQVGRDVVPVTEDGLNVFVYGGVNATDDIVPTAATETVLDIFSKFRIDGDNVISRNDATGDAPDGMFYIEDYNTEEHETAVEVTAYAIQADGFENALAAWKTASVQFGN